MISLEDFLKTVWLDNHGIIDPAWKIFETENEFAFKANTKDLPAFDVKGKDCGITAVRAFLAGMEGRQLPYKTLIANV